jgi:hypothetical protein
MDLLNPLSLARARTEYPRRRLEANCLASDNAGDAVYVTGDRVGTRYQVTKVDISDVTKMPAIGVILEKTSSTECVVVTSGEVEGVYTGLTAGGLLFLDAAGTIAQSPPVPAPLQTLFLQSMGIALDSSVILLAVDFRIVRRGKS